MQIHLSLHTLFSQFLAFSFSHSWAQLRLERPPFCTKVSCSAPVLSFCMKVYDAILLYDFLSVCEAVFGECRCFVGIELVSETTDEERSAAEGVKPDLVQGIEFAYTLPAADLVVIFTKKFFFPPQFAAFCCDSSLANCMARSRLPIKFGCVVPNAAKCKTKQTQNGQISPNFF